MAKFFYYMFDFTYKVLMYFICIVVLFLIVSIVCMLIIIFIA